MKYVASDVFYDRRCCQFAIKYSVAFFENVFYCVFHCDIEFKHLHGIWPSSEEKKCKCLFVYWLLVYFPPILNTLQTDVDETKTLPETQEVKAIATANKLCFIDIEIICSA